MTSKLYLSNCFSINLDYEPEFSDLNLSKSKFILIKYKSGRDVSSEFASFVETVRIKCA